jgi:hypothetical protein
MVIIEDDKSPIDYSWQEKHQIIAELFGCVVIITLRLKGLSGTMMQ